jgi:acyl-CoA thioesterase-1
LNLNDGWHWLGRGIDFIMALVTFRTVSVLVVAGIAVLVAAGLTGCGGSEAKPVVVVEKNAPATPPPAPVPAKDDGRPLIVVFGDSLSAGYGLETGQSFPDELQKILDQKQLSYRVVNQGLSGDTTSGGLSRIDQCIALKPKFVLLELGGNDGLRGISVATVRKNLDTMIRKLQDAGATVVLVGITLPRNYGDDYIRGFEKNYVELAKEHKLTTVPFLLEGIWTPEGGAPGMIQPDGIHPTAKATPVMAATVFKRIEKLLR